MKYIKTPVTFIYHCETCGLEELVDATGDHIALVQGDYVEASRYDESKDVASRGLEMARVFNAYDNLVIACERAKTYFDRVLIQTGDGEVMELVECLSDALAADKEN